MVHFFHIGQCNQWHIFRVSEFVHPQVNSAHPFDDPEPASVDLLSCKELFSHEMGSAQLKILEMFSFRLPSLVLFALG